MKITLQGRYYLDGSDLTIVWEDGKVSAPFHAHAELDRRVKVYGGRYLKAPWGPIKADLKSAEGFYVLAAPLFNPPLDIPDFEIPQDGEAVIQ